MTGDRGETPITLKFPFNVRLEREWSRLPAGFSGFLSMTDGTSPELQPVHALRLGVSNPSRDCEE